ncbi:MAG: hypothetical protein WC455_18380 [Dehalococcoidia bacterium]|jgi:hypothetical protein
MNFNFDDISKIYDRNSRFQFVERELAKLQKNDPPFISDCIIRADSFGGYVLKVLSEDELKCLTARIPGFRWRIRAHRTEWGSVPKPGEYVIRTFPINRKNRDEQPVSADVINTSISDGSYRERFEMEKKFLIDDKGCIECGYDDAAFFLINNGMHSKTKTAICRHPEHSTEPCKSPSGQMLHVWYWRYSEIDEKDYANLPVLASNHDTATQKRRGE